MERGTTARPRGSSFVRQLLRWSERLFLAIGAIFLGACAAIYVEAYFYQTVETRRFTKALERSLSATGVKQPPGLAAGAADGSLIGRLEIPRLGLSVMVRQGDREQSLRVAAGHIPGTAWPGQPGNVGIAAHRDTFFRRLRYVRVHDTITLTTLSGAYSYSVESIRVVSPNDAQVLRAFSHPSLTLVTCYPFYYLGPAPKRFIVRARQIGGGACRAPGLS